MQGSSAARAAAQPRQPETLAVEPQSSSGSALVPVEHLQSLMTWHWTSDWASHYMSKKLANSVGPGLGDNTSHQSQWSKSEPVCTSCSPVDERFQGRLLQTKPCARCQLDVARDGFSKSQWERGAASVCKACTVVRTTERDNSRVWSISLSQFTYLCFLILFLAIVYETLVAVWEICFYLIYYYFILHYILLYYLVLYIVVYVIYIYIVLYIVLYVIYLYNIVLYIILYCIIIYVWYICYYKKLCYIIWYSLKYITRRINA